MEKIRNILFHLGRVWLTGLSFVAIAFFAVEAFEAKAGLPALKQLEAQKAKIQKEYQAVQSELTQVSKNVELMDKSSIDPDMLEEQVRKKLGFVASDEIILLTDE